MKKSHVETKKWLNKASARFAEEVRLFEIARSRVGEIPQDKLAWVLSVTNKNPQSPGDWMNLRQEIRAFTDEGGLQFKSRAPLPSGLEAEAILNDFRDV